MLDFTTPSRKSYIYGIGVLVLEYPITPNSDVWLLAPDGHEGFAPQ